MKNLMRLLLLLALLLTPAGLARADQLPVVLLAGFASRVPPSRSVAVPQEEILSAFENELSAELAGDPRYHFYDRDADTAAARKQEAALVGSLEAGTADPDITKQADYILYGYLTDMSEIRSQAGVLVLSGKSRTIHLAFSLRVMDAHTGRIIYTCTASSRRKSELIYHTPLYRHDKGQEDAVAAAVSIAAQNMAAELRRAM